MTALPDDQDLTLDEVVVTAAQMQQIEAALFAAGLPVAALMEKVAGRIAQWVMAHYPRDRTPTIGCIVGPGHNGGDALVVARELHHQGYQVLLWCPFTTLKPLTAQHQAYAAYLGLTVVAEVSALQASDLIVDGGFGSGLTRPLSGAFAQGLETINTWAIPVVSLDLPSGLATDSGAVLGAALRATHTLCLGLWKLGLLQDQALPWVGTRHLLPFDIPLSTIAAVLADSAPLRRLTAQRAIAALPLPRSPIAHKYTAGHALLIAGSAQYGGAALLAAQGAIASGVGMLTVVVPASLRLMVLSHMPEALVLGAPETATGAIAQLPSLLPWAQYDAVACGPGLTLQAEAVMAQILACDRPLILDADGLNWLAHHDPLQTLRQRTAPTLLTPHPGEFRRLFPTLGLETTLPGEMARQAAQAAHCTLVLKGAMSAIAHPKGHLWLNPESSPALARGGSGDVLTGLVCGLAAQHGQTRPHSPDNLWQSAIA
ncbi:MAG TPA: NAD(P)H-hydrate dehydratase, partial [Candidatus Obscuribacterales bacterium]